MLYFVVQNGSKVSLRRAFSDKKQIFSYGNSTCDKHALLRMAKEVGSQLDAGTIVEADVAEAFEKLLGQMYIFVVCGCS